MALEAVQALVTEYRQIERKIYRISGESLEKETLTRKKDEMRSQLKQIFEQCDNILGITKEYKRKIAIHCTSDSDSENECWD